MKNLINLCLALLLMFALLLVSACVHYVGVYPNNMCVNQCNKGKLQTNLMYLLGIKLDEVPISLGNIIDDEYGFVFHRHITFDSGLEVAVNESENIHWAFIQYSQEESIFHFCIINNSSSYNDVLVSFGHDPDNIRSGIDEEVLGAIKSYGYWFYDNIFVRFFFNNNREVIAISTFFSERPQNDE